MIVLYGVLAAIVLFAAVILLRTAAFRPKEQPVTASAPVSVDTGRAVAHLQEFIRCKTVSSTDWAKVDEAEFEKFRSLLPQLYPHVFAACECERIGSTGLLFYLKGESDQEPSVMMAHYDVVPAAEEAWEKPAFEGVLEDGVVWGRGTLDTKTTLLSVLEGAETLLAGGFVPKKDLYFSFSGDEEVSGPSAPAIVAELKRRGVHPALVVDEGGAVVENVFPGVSAPCALVGTGEKGPMNLEFSMAGSGGHASAPPPHTLVGELSKACVAVEKKPFPSQMTQPAAQMFDTLGRHSTFLYRMIFANLWCFRPLLDALCKKTGGELNALMRTTCAFTCMQGSKGENVLPPQAKMVANLRLIGSDTPESAMKYIRKVIKNENITLTKLYGMNPSPSSRTDTAGWAKVKNAIGQTWPGALVSPYLMVACSDSRHFCEISENVYRFSAMALSKEERGEIHGNNERIPVKTIEKAVEFYIRLLKEC